MFLKPDFLFIYPFSRYYIVMINVTESSPVQPDTVGDDQLKPYSGPESLVYVAAVLTSDEYDPSQPYTLGSFTSTFFEGVTYNNTPPTVGQYHCFVRAFTIQPVSYQIHVINIICFWCCRD